MKQKSLVWKGNDYLFAFTTTPLFYFFMRLIFIKFIYYKYFIFYIPVTVLFKYTALVSIPLRKETKLH